ncbi:MAG: hypothetical protein HYW57_10595 [Ignavibacteriales bacterium]|nr:hypothetical protein [Ignavibacteriales bacterium]
MNFRPIFPILLRMASTQFTSLSRNVSPKQLKSFETLVVAAGIKPDPFFKALRSDLSKTPDPIRAANNFHRFLSAGFSSALLTDFQQHPVLRQIVLELFAQSQYLADILVRDPELFRWLTAGNALKVAKSKSDFLSEALNAVQLFTRTEKKLDSLKRFHRREILRIGSRDILNESNMVMITKELSDLADVIIECLLRIGQQELAARTGARFKSSLVVIGLGKLGGGELNFSSDVDLLFVYDQDGEFQAPQERIRTYHEYYNRLSEFVVRRLSEVTAEGYLYRVDMRLRPEGSAGPLALSKSASLQYYEMRGELWERQMLIKARPIAGDLEVGKQWLQSLQPFVFPRTFLESPLREISTMKQRIEERVNNNENIKLGGGGIRDIEFVVQALQLLNVGSDERLREPNTLLALDRLTERQRIRPTDGRVLAHAYRFFRTVEHRLQLLHGAQTHSLPDTASEREVLALRLGYATGAGLAREISDHRKRVRSIFNFVFAEKSERGKSVTGVEKKRTKITFLQWAESANVLKRFQETMVPEAGGQDRFLRLLKHAEAPDWGLRNFALLVNSLFIRRTLLQAATNEQLLNLLVLICSRSRQMAQKLALEPLLFETLAGQPEEFFREGFSWTFLGEHDLVRFKEYNEFKILVPFLLGRASIEKTTSRLSALAGEILARRCRQTPGFENLVLVALGKLGGEEITVRSDLDLIPVYRADRISAEDAENAVKSFVSGFSEGKPYSLDFRLRPEGKNSPLATEFIYYKEYFEVRASVWERQLLTKARTVLGDAQIRIDLKNLWSEAAYGKDLPKDWINRILEMRKRVEKERTGRGGPPSDLKTGRGGLMDLEFLLQMLQLRFGRTLEKVRVPNSFFAARLLVKNRILKPEEGKRVQRNLEYFRRLETALRMNSDRPDLVIPKDPVVVQALAAFMGESKPAAFLKKLISMKKENRDLFKATLRRCRKSGQ